MNRTPAVSLILLAALVCAACSAMQPKPAPKAPQTVEGVRVLIVNEGNSHEQPEGATTKAPASDTIGATLERALQQSLSQSGLRVVSSCEDEGCAHLEARIASESWTDEDPYTWTNARATVTLVNVRDGEVLGQGTGQGVLADGTLIHPNAAGHIANSALEEAFKSPMLADADFGQRKRPTTGDSDDGGQSDEDAQISHVGQPQPSAYAVVIGIEDYRDLPATPGSRADAQAFGELLQTSLGVPEANIRTLIDDRATKSDVEQAIRWVRNNVPSKGRVYLYFSGHGAPDPTEGTAYLLPYEARSNDIAHGGFAIEELLSELSDSEAGEVFAFVDSCFSGEGERSVLEEGIRPVVPVRELDAKDKSVLFSASGPKEISGTTEDGASGLFTHHLLAAIGRGEADVDGDGTISLSELEAYVGPRVAREAKRLSREQNPVLTIGEAFESTENLLLVWGLGARR